MNWHSRALAALATLIAATTVGTTTSAAETPDVRGVLPAIDREVQFDADGTTTYATVHVPAHRAGHRMAAALLLPGSGPTDRDGNEPPALTPSTLALIADALGGDEVMTLRFDKYGTGRTGLGQYRDDPGRIDMAALTRQAAAAYGALRSQPEADPHALLIVGHSEGALRALLVAPVVRPEPAGLALLAPQDQRILDILDYQLAAQIDQYVAAGLLTAAQGEANKKDTSRAIADFRAGRSVDTSGIIPPIATTLNDGFGPLKARYVRTDDAIYPPDAARRIAPGTRVVVTCGTADANVPCRTTPPLVNALAAARTGGPGLKTLYGLDHLLHQAGTPVNTKTLAPAALRALHDFIRPWSRQ
ncbi:alpha/beta fold hydrolase [Streptomyces sp. CB01881]|uniref:alpha/beta fold hydrolase n=1 Tax=Streptomyces sp. CB01881 TaxID=2078691 RepID=UPI000CDC4C35|nr:alpha/beta fold hydrolase [Streptomyces sp. CB01881]AUY53245.1 alpha/beta hydrolase [Streptomyces sp. CB01881]TYC69403.1 alpha/beta fold hydrolase [Streptomyces sp. CB01881]